MIETEMEIEKKRVTYMEIKKTKSRKRKNEQKKTSDPKNI